MIRRKRNGSGPIIIDDFVGAAVRKGTQLKIQGGHQVAHISGTVQNQPSTAISGTVVIGFFQVIAHPDCSAYNGVFKVALKGSGVSNPDVVINGSGRDAIYRNGELFSGRVACSDAGRYKEQEKQCGGSAGHGKCLSGWSNPEPAKDNTILA